MNVLWRLVDEVSALAAGVRKACHLPNGEVDLLAMDEVEDLEKLLALARHALETLGIQR